jgi:peptidyl-prolyl cis-trans isomerase C
MFVGTGCKKLQLKRTRLVGEHVTIQENNWLKNIIMRYLSLTLALTLFIDGNLFAADNLPETVLIKQGETTVSEADYKAAVADLPEQHRASIEASGERIHQLLDRIFVYRVLAQEARELDLNQDPLLRKQVKMAVEEVLGKARLENLREQALAAKPDFEALARERYQTSQDEYQLPERVKVSHILIKSEGKGEEAEKKARQLAEKVHKLALAKEKPFAELALQYSEDSSVDKNKGNLGFISQGMTVKPFEEAAFALQKPGEISPVIKSQFGFHVIRLEERQPARVRPFKQVKKELIAEIKESYLNKLVQAHIHQIRNAKGIEMNKEALRNLRQH